MPLTTTLRLYYLCSFKVVRKPMMAVWGLIEVWWMWFTPLSSDDSLPSLPRKLDLSGVLPSVLVWIPENHPDSWMDLGVRIVSHEPWLVSVIFLRTSLQTSSYVMTRHWPIFSVTRLVDATHNVDCVICFCLYSQPGRECLVVTCVWGGRNQVLDIFPRCAWDPQPGAECYLSSLSSTCYSSWHLSVAPQFPIVLEWYVFPAL